MDIEQTSDLWWKDAVFYCLDVKTFLDSDGDGIGDLAGLTERLDYLSGLNVDCLWLMPFYPSPWRDDGYDITDFETVHPDLGSLGDFVEMARTAGDRGLRLIVDLVVNHTSSDHPWFESSRSSRESPRRDFYVWRDEPPDDWEDVIVFPGEQDGNWTFDEATGQWYLHIFLEHQPDLNIANPAVRDAITRVMGLWLQLGVDGFRVDAVPFLLQEIDGDEGYDPHDYLSDLRRFVGRRRGDALLMGEVNLPPDEQLEFFDGDRGPQLQLVLNFTVNQAMYLALARQDATPLAAALRRLPPIPEDCQWANFVRNHDELTLDQLTDDERAEVFAAFGPDEDMQLYGRGLRRRLPAMVGGDERRMRLVYSLMLSLPGSPVIFYGEELGMAENLEVEGRLAVRTPMQWSSDEHGGFAPPGTPSLVRPQPTGCFGPDQVNVADQRSDPDSFLSWFERVVRRRRECPELGWGAWSVIDAGDGRVLAHRADWRGSTIVALHNLADAPVEVAVAVDGVDDEPSAVDLLERARPVPIDGDRIALELPPYGYRWFRLRPAGHRQAP